MITFAAIAPHSPVLLPQIGKEHQGKLKKTIAAYRTLEEELYASKSEVLLIISPHNTTLKDAFTIFISPSYRTNLKEFGDFSTALEFKADLATIDALRRLKDGSDGCKLIGMTEDFLDYGTAIPLCFITAHLDNPEIIPLGVSGLSVRSHFDFGVKMRECLEQSKKRVAIIASSDLSHTLSDAAPGGFSPDGKSFDAEIVQALRKNKPQKILALEKRADAAKACGLRPIAVLLGVLNGMNYTSEPLSYEGPFGVGYLVAHFAFR